MQKKAGQTNYLLFHIINRKLSFNSLLNLVIKLKKKNYLIKIIFII